MGGGPDFLGWSEGGPTFSRGQKGSQHFLRGQRGANNFFKWGANYFAQYLTIHNV